MDKIEQRKHNMLYNPNMIKTMILMSLPLFFSNLLKSFHDIVDSFFLARMDVSADTVASSLAAINIHWSIYNMFAALGIGIAVAAVGIVSQYVGARREKEAQSYSAKLITFAFTIGLLVTALLYLFTPLIGNLMGAKGETHTFFVRYLRLRSFEFPFYFVFAVYQSIRQARGDTISPVIISVGSIVWNIFITWVLVFQLKMGVLGAGISTLSAQIVIFPFVIYQLFHTKKHPRVRYRDLGFDKLVMKEITRFALPSALSNMFSALGFAVIQSMILSYGDVVSSGFSTGNRISSMLLNPAMAIGSVQAAFIGQNIGNHNPERAKKSYRTATLISVSFMTVGAIFTLIFLPQIIALLIGTKNMEINRVAIQYSYWLIATQPLMGLYNNYMSVYNGSGNNKYALIMSLTRLWAIRIPLILLFMYVTPQVGVAGIWYAMVISNVTILILGEILYRRISFERKVRITDEEPLEEVL